MHAVTRITHNFFPLQFHDSKRNTENVQETGVRFFIYMLYVRRKSVTAKKFLPVDFLTNKTGGKFSYFFSFGGEGGAKKMHVFFFLFYIGARGEQ